MSVVNIILIKMVRILNSQPPQENKSSHIKLGTVKYISSLQTRLHSHTAQTLHKVKYIHATVEMKLMWPYTVFGLNWRSILIVLSDQRILSRIVVDGIAYTEQTSVRRQNTKNMWIETNIKTILSFNNSFLCN